ncbi:SpoIVB peptidase [Garciella nitratireducens]|uniref:Stage IV sporulation protein B n=1 Tax=Garciella nitratireducens DSM 15102 TaxID=1121911 RepID=A0A1T4JTA6_9FIRM|nr:SpoIVB peptidase [Garciella nitratireducens]SJZ33287.1 stage IV sporulation protein B [Garciella nitratireducens DSM 15102]
MIKIKKSIGIFLIILLLIVNFNDTFQFIVNFPNELYVLEGEKRILNFNLPFSISAKLEEENKIMQVNGLVQNNYQLNLNEPIKLQTSNTGEIGVQLKLFGVIPIKNMKVKVLPDVKLYPGGQSIGVKLKTEGVIVVGLSEITGEDGKSYCPGLDANVNVGDIIYKINGKRVNTAEDVSRIVNHLTNQPVELNIKRKNRWEKISIKPIKDEVDGQYKIGLWVRDNTAGIGTLTFYHEGSNKYGALGHAITDVTTGIIMPVNDGEIVSAKVGSVLHGEKGKPGEIRGIFYNEDKVIGNIEKNTSQGLYGSTYTKLINNKITKPISIGLQQHIKEGPAKILTTIEGNQVEEFDVEIEKIVPQSKKSEKGMIIQVTDSELLKKTGGIVQGMSGSPIIQNNKLVGAVTHVFVNDPTKGYGIFIEWMLEEANINLTEQ